MCSSSPQAPHFAPAERRTLSLLAAGLSNLEICETTAQSIRVVKAHVRRAHQVSGLDRRPDVTVWAASQGFGVS